MTLDDQLMDRNFVGMKQAFPKFFKKVKFRTTLTDGYEKASRRMCKN